MPSIEARSAPDVPLDTKVVRPSNASHPSAPVAAAPAGSRLRNADGIRGLACLMVLLVHGIAFFWSASVPWLEGAGKLGVWLFFVLSSLLLTRRLESQDWSRRALADYAIGRALRILPAYALAVLLYWRLGTAGIDSRSDVVAALTLQRGYSHLWTIPVEFAFYGLLPLFAWPLARLRRHTSTAWMLVACIALILALQGLWPYWLTPKSSADVLWYLPCFLCGIAAALALEGGSPRGRLADVVGAGCLLAILASVPWIQHLLTGRIVVPIMDKFVFFGAIWALFAFTQVRSEGWLGHVLASKPFAFVGRVSYSVYLLHWLVLSLLSRRWPGSATACVAAVACSIVAGCIGWWLVERPAEALRRRIARSL